MTVGSYVAKWLRAKTTDDDICVLAFVANRRAASYVHGLSEAEGASMIAGASGFLGSNLEYLVRTHCRAFGARHQGHPLGAAHAAGHGSNRAAIRCSQARSLSVPALRAGPSNWTKRLAHSLSAVGRP
ncbi:gamma-glutamylcyclotransferase [Bradyrhizobium sp. Pear77]|nr:gamma-glutamylcyclotransferase [Bradyrhizobium altum]